MRRKSVFVLVLIKIQKYQTLNETSIKKIYNELEKFLTVFQEGKIQPVFVKKDGTIIDILPVPFLSYTNMEFETTLSFSKGLEPFIHVRKVIKPQETKHRKNIEKLQRQQAQQQELIEGFKKSIAQKKLEADLIYLHFQTIEKILQEITVLLRQKEKVDGISKICQNPLVKLFDPTANELIVFLTDEKGNSLEVTLDFRKSVSENAAADVRRRVKSFRRN